MFAASVAAAPEGLRVEMFDCGDSPLVPPELPTRMKRGVPPALSCWAMT